MIAITSLEMRQHLQQRGVEPARRVAGSRRHEFVVEAELIEKGAQPRVVVRGEACMRAERIGHFGQRLAEMLRQHLLVGNVVRHLAQAVHVVGERDQPGLDRVVGQHAEGVAHHGGARDFAESADMRQAGRAVAGLEDHLVLRALLSAARRSCAPPRTARRATASASARRSAAFSIQSGRHASLIANGAVGRATIKTD